MEYENIRLKNKYIDGIVSIGDKFYNFTIEKIFDDYEHKNKGKFCLAKCICGTEKVLPLYYIVSGDSKSCGCLRGKGNTKKYKNVYDIWRMMKKRCFDKNAKEYINYGKRGITICPDWLEYETFLDWALENGYEKGLSIERIDNNGNYCPQNCKWIPLEKQARNRRNNHFITYAGKTKCLAEWAEIVGINQDVIKDRLNRYNWTIEEALGFKKRKKKRG